MSRKFCSDDPTNLSRTSGPLTTVIGRKGESIDPSFDARSVLPHPGPPYRSRPKGMRDEECKFIPITRRNDK